ncbi:hypothetical protein G7067_04880 [Leucobacter insecticola]|uniref:Bacterial Ig-like domain-containing protein n=1 Tax=Leucobacter insecticola TaxID=2714934 RepID=A0A6G8FHR8_9MICO|nr:HtaA domain-containing protein [Leucobacter insecticola]QIM15904.1 hypothetical protein G7067_04880 [Leucobacter insecticola]
MRRYKSLTDVPRGADILNALGVHTDHKEHATHVCTSKHSRDHFCTTCLSTCRGGAILGGGAAYAEELPADPAIEQAQAAVVSASVVEASTSGITVKVDLSGVAIPAGKAGVYAALVPAGTLATIGDGSFLPAVALSGGSGSLSYTIPAALLDPNQSYEALVWYAHGNPEPSVIVSQVPVPISAEQWNSVFPQPVAIETSTTLSVSTTDGGASFTLNAQVTPVAAGNVAFATATEQLGSVPVVDGVASLTVSTLSPGSHSITAMFTPEDQTAFTPSTSVPTEVTVPEVEQGVTGSAVVTEASETGLTVSAEIKGVDPAAYPNGVHVGVVLRGTSVGATQNDFLGETQSVKTIPESGEFGASVPIPAASLDASKEYEVVVWPRRSNPVEANIVKVIPFDVTTDQWAKVFPVGVTGSAVVTEASETGLTVSAEIKGVDPAAYPNGVHVGVVLRGTSVGATQNDFLGETQSVKTIPESGEFGASVPIPAASLDASKEYEVVVWPRRSNPVEANIVKVIPFDVTTDQWAKVFPVGVTGSAVVTEASETGLTVSAEIKGVDPAAYPNGVHVGVVLRGTSVGATQNDFLGETQSVKTIPESGEFGASVPIPAASLDASKEYEVVVWPRRSNPVEANIVKVIPFDVTTDQWAKVFPVGVTGSAVVTEASETGLTVSAEIKGVDPAAYPNGVHVGVVLRGTSVGATQNDFLGETQSVKTIPESGEFGASVPIPAASLDASKEYEVVVWPRRSNPVEANIVKVIPFDVTTDQWAKVFPPAGAKVQPGISHVGSDGISVTAVASGITLEPSDSGVYIALIERGTEADLDGVNMGVVAQFVNRSSITEGKATVVLNGTAAKLNRNLEYEVLVWRAHGIASPDRIVARADVDITAEQWDKIFGVDFVPAGSAAVSRAEEGVLSVAASLRGFDPARYNGRLHIGLIPAGTSATATNASVIGAQTVASVPSNGVFVQEVRASASQLDRTKQYEVLVWQGSTGPGVDHNVLTLPFSVTEEIWDAVFPPKVETLDGSFEWGVRKDFRDYVRGSIANGSITVTSPATGTDLFRFPQIKGGTWDSKTQTGTVQFAGNINFKGHGGALNLNLANPLIEVKDSRTAVLHADQGGERLAIATIDLSKAQRSQLQGGAVQFSGAPVKLTQVGAETFFQEYLSVNDNMDAATFTIGAAADVKPPVVPPAPPKPPVPPAPPAPITPGTGAQLAGSLTWGVSSGFAEYTTNPNRPAKGSISTNGVGGGRGGYVFPQAAGGSWNASTQTGSVQYSGVVTFTGHKGAMVESFANPVITVNDASSGTLTAGGRTFGLNLAAGSKSVGSNGEVTWSGVPVSGMVSGAGGGGGGEFAADPVSFTVGAVSGVRYGSTTVSAPSTKRTAAATAPTTTGIRVITPAEDIVPGGEIEFEAAGFKANERDVLVVMYSEPRVLDDAAGANAAGVVRWIGTLPEDVELGEHTITLQGSIDAGATFTVLDPKKAEADKQKRDSAASAPKLDVAAAQTAGISETGAPVWVWWVGAGVLLVIAAAMVGVLVAQRRSGMKDLQMFGMS